jgi:DNA-binding MarR family transcriptional regulator
MNREQIDNVLRSLRRVNLQGSFLGQTVAIRFGLSESDVETLEQLIDMGATTAGKLSEITGLTSGAVTRVIDRLERAGYVRRVPDPTDRRRVIVEVVPEKVAAIESTLHRVTAASAEHIGRYTEAQLALIGDFLTKMEEINRAEAASLRETPAAAEGEPHASEHSAPLGALREARLAIRSGLSSLRLRSGAPTGELYRARFEGATPQVRLRDARVLIQYRGLPFDWRQRVATIGLTTAIPWTVEIAGGIQKVEADLRSVDLRRFELAGGAERIQLELGRPSGRVQARVVGGVKALRLERPRGVPVRIEITGGAGEISLDGVRLDRRGGQSAVESPDWAGSTDGIELAVVGGSRTIDVVARG